MQTAEHLFSLAPLIAVFALLVGCSAGAGDGPKTPTTLPAGPAVTPAKGLTLLFDGAHPLKTMPHVKIVDSPFASTTQPGGTTQPAEKVLKGGPLGPEEKYQNKGTFVRDGGFFVVPPEAKVELVVVVAMTGLTDLKVEVWAKDPQAGQVGTKFNKALPAAAGWQTVAVPLDPAKFKPGAVVNDITIFQVGKDPAARLFIRSVSLRVE